MPDYYQKMKDTGSPSRRTLSGGTARAMRLTTMSTSRLRNAVSKRRSELESARKKWQAATLSGDLNAAMRARRRYERKSSSIDTIRGIRRARKS